SSVDASVADSVLEKNSLGVAGAIRLLADQGSTLDLDVTDTTFSRNKGYLGLGLLAESTSSNGMNVTVKNSALIRNRAQSRIAASGAGIWDSGGSELTVALENNVMARNGSAEGGGIFARGSLDLSLVNCTIVGNRARSFYTPAPSYGTGGGIDLEGPLSA